ncbi:hypothetical protein EYF80_026527 [Liparis tanakae]|uniref:Uncharacterized protein n=1 Tax=Liparis tanakae TaxID=230148 RepID=A0A4Z2HBZ2_9TELE|nr:hypothetical protein EYF80_026527 [Liparis tanakae]
MFREEPRHLLSVSVSTLTWLLHSLKRGPVITRHDCSTVTSFTMLSLQGADDSSSNVRSLS